MVTRSKPQNTPLIVGRERFAKISAVEGIRLSDRDLTLLAKLDQVQSTPAGRRAAIIKQFSKRPA